jgi:enterochelin esterase-like enzyme
VDEKPTPNVTRRALLIGGAATALAGSAALAGVESGVLPGRSALHRVVGLNGPAGSIPPVETGQILTGTLTSAARLGTVVEWAISYPPGSSPGDTLPVLIVLHGFSGTHATSFGAHLGLDSFQADAVASGGTPFAIASIDGGDTYWHARSSGEDSGRMVTDEFIPLLRERGLNTDRLTLLGWSMGGYGALLLGGRLGPATVAAVVAESPALWPSFAEAASIAFDDARDFAENTVYGREGELDGIPLRIDCGDGDGFGPNVRRYIESLTEPIAGGFEPGGHDMEYWRRMAPDQLAFIGEQFAATPPR